VSVYAILKPPFTVPLRNVTNCSVQNAAARQPPTSSMIEKTHTTASEDDDPNDDNGSDDEDDDGTPKSYKTLDVRVNNNRLDMVIGHMTNLQQSRAKIDANITDGKWRLNKKLVTHKSRPVKVGDKIDFLLERIDGEANRLHIIDRYEVVRIRNPPEESEDKIRVYIRRTPKLTVNDYSNDKLA